MSFDTYNQRAKDKFDEVNDLRTEAMTIISNFANAAEAASLPHSAKANTIAGKIYKLAEPDEVEAYRLETDLICLKANAYSYAESAVELLALPEFSERFAKEQKRLQEIFETLGGPPSVGSPLPDPQLGAPQVAA